MTDNSSKAFTFVQGLAADLQQGEIELPAFPDVVNRLRIILVDPNSSAKDVVEVIAVDPILTTRLVKMANSAALNPKGIKIENLGSAISRLGFNLVRSTATNPELLQDDAYLDVVETWQAGIGRHILESWTLPEPICDAIEGMQQTLSA